ncbi:latent-transforming growth factor beta-binding protein 2-like isoform X2 [Octopus sinensis]|uniref:Latent-transforming growth factor beta-binding protein 2-like isoform X2 n=1 Tax=Octopus sinensis TaxID=2607531 RepID=A0A6P7TIA5_9MOLL|nr:latent-transforming growth factor beta-binding protein 2-like isoform X2 [Octopus sinensis]
MKKLVFFLLIFVVVLWETEGQLVTGGKPLVSGGLPVGNEEEIVTAKPLEDEEVSESEDVSVTEARPSHDADAGNSTSEGERLAASPTKRTCKVSCDKILAYKKLQRVKCKWGTCIRYSTKYRRIPSICIRCCKGWTGVPGRCRDINECTWRDRCGTNGRCNNTLGSYKCVCNRGYRWDGRTCVDINECATIRLMPHYKCYNTPGSFYIDCMEGFQKIKEKCIGIGTI